MHEVIDMLKEDKQPIRLPDATVLPVPEGGIPTEQTDMLDLTLEAQEVRDVLLEVMAEKGMGEATLKVERVRQIVNGSAALKTRAEEDLKVLIETFADEHTPLPASSVINQETRNPHPRGSLREWRRCVRHV